MDRLTDGVKQSLKVGRRKEETSRAVVVAAAPGVGGGRGTYLELSFASLLRLEVAFCDENIVMQKKLARRVHSRKRCVVVSHRVHPLLFLRRATVALPDSSVSIIAATCAVACAGFSWCASCFACIRHVRVLLLSLLLLQIAVFLFCGPRLANSCREADREFLSRRYAVDVGQMPIPALISTRLRVYPPRGNQSSATVTSVLCRALPCCYRCFVMWRAAIRIAT